jgi:putative ABC transport system permease protein
MFQTYLKLALRTLRSHVGYTTLNAVGLTIGLACLMVVALYLHHETRYDTHHAHAERTYRMVQDIQSGSYGVIQFITNDRPREENTGLVPPHLRETVPEVEQAAQFVHQDNAVFATVDERRAVVREHLYTSDGAAFFDLFTFDAVDGSLSAALHRPNTAVLTATAATRIFGADARSGNESLVGRTFTLASDATPAPLTVNAVIADPPSTSHFTFGVAIRPGGPLPSWGAQTYVRLVDGADPVRAASKIQAAFLSLNPRYTKPPNLIGFRLQALPDIHLGEPVLRSSGTPQDVRYLWAFALIATIVLAITVTNYANLSVALYTRRRSEVGVRKALGAHRGQIAGQFLAEAVLLALGGLAAGLAVVEFVLPAFNDLMGVELTNAFARTLPGLAIALAGAVGIGLIAGVYPAWHLARKAAVSLFDDALSAGGRRWSLRHGLIAVQLVLLIGLGSFAWLVQQQLHHLRTADTGLPTSGVVEIKGLDDADDFVRFRAQLQQHPEIEAVGTGPLPNRRDGGFGYRLAGDDRVLDGSAYVWADLGWFDVMGIDAPRLDRLRERPDADTTFAFVNQTLATRVGQPVREGTTLYMEATDDQEGFPYVLSGVLPDVHLSSLHTAQQPVFYRVHDTRPSWVYNAVVRFDAQHTTAAMDHLQAAWTQIRPDEPLRTTFLSTRLADLYAQERQFGTLSTVLTGLAILLASLGLAGLSAFVARQRQKEIGIRKALGATLGSLVVLLNREIVALVGGALVVGAPLAWWAADAWLASFAHRIGIHPLVFVGTGIAALAIALIASSVQIARAARVDPAQVLRAE